MVYEISYYMNAIGTASILFKVL